MIIFFSGTGNSRYVAKKIAEVTGDKLINLNELIRNKKTVPIGENEQCIFVVPTYAWRIPRIVEQWIRNTRFEARMNAWFVMTCGDEIGNAGKYNKILCEDKQFLYMGTAQIVMPENYIAMFAVPKPSTARKIIDNAEPVISQVADMIRDGDMLPERKVSVIDRIKSGPVNPVFYSMCVKAQPFYAKDTCISCGKCEKLCPLQNIKLTGGRPVWGNDCTHCMACIAYCPTEAIEYGKKSVGKPRYHHD